MSTATTTKRMTTDHSSCRSRRRGHLLSGSCRSLCVGGKGRKVVQRIKSCRRRLHYPEKLTFHLLEGRPRWPEHVRRPGGLPRWISRPRTWRRCKACLEGIDRNVPVAVEPAAAKLLMPNTVRTVADILALRRMARRTAPARGGTLAACCRGQYRADTLTAAPAWLVWQVRRHLAQRAHLLIA